MLFFCADGFLKGFFFAAFLFDFVFVDFGFLATFPAVDASRGFALSAVNAACNFLGRLPRTISYASRMSACVSVCRNASASVIETQKSRAE